MKSDWGLVVQRRQQVGWEGRKLDKVLQAVCSYSTYSTSGSARSSLKGLKTFGRLMMIRVRVVGFWFMESNHDSQISARILAAARTLHHTRSEDWRKLIRRVAKLARMTLSKDTRGAHSKDTRQAIWGLCFLSLTRALLLGKTKVCNPRFEAEEVSGLVGLQLFLLCHFPARRSHTLRIWGAIYRSMCCLIV